MDAQDDEWAEMKQVLERFKVPELRPLMILGIGLVMAAVLLTWAVLVRAGSPTFIRKLDQGGLYLVIAVLGAPSEPASLRLLRTAALGRVRFS